MSSAVINMSVGGLLTVAGTTTLSGALTSASTLNTQGITTTELTVNGNTTLSGNLTAGSIVITNAQLGRLSGAKQNIQGQLDRISVNNLIALTSGTGNLPLGNTNMNLITTGSNNIGIGTSTLSNTTISSNNIAIGVNSGGFFNMNDNIAIGTNSGASGVNSFAGSTCIGVNSKITGSDQIVLGTNINTVKLLGGIDISGNVLLLGNIITGTTTITNAQLGHISGSGSNIQGQLNKISINNLLNVSTGTKNFAVGDFNMSSLNTGSFNVGIGTDTLTQTTGGNYNIAIGDLAGGGVLGSNNICIGRFSGSDPYVPTNFNNSICIGLDSKMSASNQIVLGTTLHTIKTFGAMDISGNVSLSSNSIFLKQPTDQNHSLVWNASSDGPALKGLVGGRLGTGAKGDILTWNTTGAVHSVAVNGNATITGNTITTGSVIETITGHNINFYRKAGCGTTETYNFQATHGLFEVFYTLNHDRTTTLFCYVDVVNNVNGGSYITVVNQGSGITTSIAVATNIFTITSSFTGGLLIINRKMAYP